MKLLTIRHLWGLDLSAGVGVTLARLRSAGYGAIEFAAGGAEASEIAVAARGEGLDVVLQAFSNDFLPGGTVAQHLESLRAQLERHVSITPRFFNVHSGSDRWSLGEAVEFYGLALELERAVAIPASHETHRARFFFTPWNTAAVLRQVPGLKLTCDFSHWVCVAERLLSDCAEEIALAADHAFHIHARVGFEEGPQVPDPRAPEYERHLVAHEAWWDAIWEAQRGRGQAVSTLTPEFGPPLYQHTRPGTLEPLCDLEEICDWMAHRQAERFRP